MRSASIGCWLLSTLVATSALKAQSPSLLRALPPMQVFIDRLRVPMTILTDAGADSLRLRVLARLRAAGMRVSDVEEPLTYGSFLDAPRFAFDKPTLLVSLNLDPGCSFVVNIHLRMPVAVAGYRERVTVGAYTSNSYVYDTTWRDHSPVLKYLDDFIGAWRAANSR